jgi:hypothetical protein
MKENHRAIRERHSANLSFQNPLESLPGRLERKKD